VVFTAFAVLFPNRPSRGEMEFLHDVPVRVMKFADKMRSIKGDFHLD